MSDKKDVMMSSGRGLIHVRVPGIASQPETEQNRNCPSNGQTLQAAWLLEACTRGSGRRRVGVGGGGRRWEGVGGGGRGGEGDVGQTLGIT